MIFVFSPQHPRINTHNSHIPLHRKNKQTPQTETTPNNHAHQVIDSDSDVVTHQHLQWHQLRLVDQSDKVTKCSTGIDL